MPKGYVRLSTEIGTCDQVVISLCSACDHLGRFPTNAKQNRNGYARDIPLTRRTPEEDMRKEQKRLGGSIRFIRKRRFTRRRCAERVFFSSQKPGVDQSYLFEKILKILSNKPGLKCMFISRRFPLIKIQRRSSLIGSAENQRRTQSAVISGKFSSSY